MEQEYLGFVYMWENLINGKKYIGLHFGKVEDGYVGSGVIFKKALKKYGIENFKRIILYYECQSIENLYKKEYDLIEEYNAVNSNEYYNLTNYDPKSNINVNIKKIITEEHRENIRKSALKRDPVSEKTKEKMSKNSGVKNKIWYNNGKIQKRFSSNETIPIGWSKGFLKTKGNTGYITYNNGIIEKQFPSDLKITDEWTKGRLKKNIKKGKDNAFFGKTHTNETKEKISKKNKGRFCGSKNPAAKSVIIEGQKYLTIKEAMEKTGFSYKKVTEIRRNNENNKKN